MGIRHFEGRELTYFTELNYSIGKNISICFSLVLVACLSLAGLPPFNGFFTKYLVILLTVQKGYLIGTFFILILLGYSVYNYLRFIKSLSFQIESKLFPKFSYKWPFGALTIITLISSLFLTPLFFYLI